MKIFSLTFTLLLLLVIGGLLGYQYIEVSASKKGEDPKVEDSSKSPSLEQNVEKESYQYDPKKENYEYEEESPQSYHNIPLKKLEEQTVHVETIATNLKGKHSFIQLSLSMVTDSKKSAEEAKNREFQLRDLIIKEASELTSQQMRDPKMLNLVMNHIKKEFNKEMDSGKVLDLYVTEKLVQ